MLRYLSPTRSDRELLLLSWPILVELFLRVIIGNINVLMISGYSEPAVAAVSSSNQLINLTVFIYGFVTVGTQIIIAQLIGAKEHHKINKVIQTGLFGAFIMGLLISLTFIFFSKQLLVFMNLPVNIVEIGKDYLQFFGGSLIVSALTAVVIAVLRSHGQTKPALIIPLVSTILAVIGNYFALFSPFGFPHLGVKGLGMSSAIANTIGLIISLYLLNQCVGYNVLKNNPLKFSKSYLGKIFKLGLPSSGESLSYQASQIVVTIIVATLGQSYLIAKSYVQTITQFVYITASAIAQGNQIMVGRFVGAKDYDNAFDRAKRSAVLGTIITIVFSFIVYLFAEQFMGIFTDNQEIIQISKIILLIDIALETGRAINMILVSALNAAGDVKFPLICSLIALWVISLPFSYLLAIVFKWGLVGVWLAYTIDEGLRSIAMSKRWQSGHWRNKNVV
ncbi:MATE family efflux transporter [Vagococcus zengguangii]|uniref:MATE family efflux transporter n=1 Tax=Vagococcus zengguangii TaxID=2571750 RepID=A0A4D7CQJ5_9ENTE|nr:MATE family efflux transporter [Vagococcus zengguangii]QCI86368.1 MATE family efflux transporter [Vagococcus zengguangii]